MLFKKNNYVITVFVKGSIYDVFNKGLGFSFYASKL